MLYSVYTWYKPRQRRQARLSNGEKIEPKTGIFLVKNGDNIRTSIILVWQHVATDLSESVFELHSM